MTAKPSGTISVMPPRGHYLANEVGQLAGVSGNTIGQWKRRGYIRASQDASHYANVYSYQDIGEAIVVHDLVIVGIPLSEIGTAVAVLREEHGTDWPLTHADLWVGDYGSADQATLLVRDDDAMFDLSQHEYPWQAVIQSQHLRRIARELNRGGWAVREIPDLRHIEVNPDRLSGRPVIRGTRVPATQVAIEATDEGNWATVAEDYGLTDSQIADARRWWHAVRRYETAIA